jgi:hypothetical protein
MRRVKTTEPIVDDDNEDEYSYAQPWKLGQLTEVPRAERGPVCIIQTTPQGISVLGRFLGRGWVGCQRPRYFVGGKMARRSISRINLFFRSPAGLCRGPLVV